ncbi:type II toxin-antitoxin system prevent-host-death family antitoxin [Acinetobacter sp. NIPH 2699]|uniref:type II toxin-antitoxin system Phd/YefM family antitoxin n=1 Tax=Acinetobacter sp. NIPH 2699 TaxID=2923433 RepID=UPI001F4ADD47|nr:type II toxin-antitoxin system prevent-host-death family antitoxin [Acinetobacter sp. NIPH 2699]MCH7337088.1 type II toxin-antitoxin system prevent-host-death family antitoxin [Acinetobacter sp. NIPH 2699]
MHVSTKELRIQSGKIIHQVQHGQEVTVTYRGKALAKIVPIQQQKQDDDIFAMWQQDEHVSTVDETVRAMRQGRQF